MGIGYIIGPELASINVAGGVLAWWVLIPLLLFFDPDLPRRLGGARGAGWDVAAYSVWYNIVRPIAVGTMLVGACNTLFSMRTLHRCSRSPGAFGASARAAHEGAAPASAPTATSRSAGWPWHRGADRGRSPPSTTSSPEAGRRPSSRPSS